MNDAAPVRRSDPGHFTATAGLDTAPVPTEPYRSPAYFEQERAQIFRRAWLCLGRVERLPEAGSYFVEDIEVVKASILVTRDKEGLIRAFHNVCPHRSNKVVLDKEGKASRLICRYHSWTFRNDGSLLAVPDETNFFDLDKAKCGLKSIACDIWDGWIFITMQPEPEVSLAEFLGDFGREHSGLPYPSAASPIVYTATLRTNWKVLSDAFAEVYHLPAIHPRTIGAMMANQGNPWSRPVDVRTWGPHRAYATVGNPGYAPPAASQIERLANGGEESKSLFVKSVDEPEIEGHPAFNFSKAPDWSSDNSCLFPNFQISRTGTFFWTFHFWPISHNETRCIATFYMPVATDIRQRLQQEYFLARNGDILLEDVGNTEGTQQGLDSGAHDVMHLQDGEILIRHSLHHIHKWIDARSVVDALD